MVTAKRSPDLVAFARQWRDAYHAGDDAFSADHTAHGEVMMLGSAPEETFRGRDAVLALSIEESTRMNEEAGLSSDPDPDAVTEAWEAGDAGWVVTHGNWRMADGSSIPTRMISVFARDDDGSWKGVFWGAHVLVPNDALRPDSPAFDVLTGARSVST
jgi:ketosteroid isomerase-like protein